MREPKKRSNSGQAASLPAIFLSFLVIGVIGLFAFEIVRVTIVRTQLLTATEAAALAGAATITSATDTDTATIHRNAINIARSVFTRNDIFGLPLRNLISGGTPGQGQTNLQFNFRDPRAGNRIVPAGNPRGKVFEVQAVFGHVPLFASFLGLAGQVYPIRTTAQGGVGELDLVLCFDCSGSMDDETKITRVRRYWDAAANRIQYETVAEGNPAGHGTILPQQLQWASGFNPDLRGSTNAGSPPGNFPPGGASNSGFTDVVVNLDENTHFAGIATSDGYNFPNVVALVEAARGNLENPVVFASSRADTALGGLVAPREGYQRKYFELARQHIHPMAEAEQAARDFFRLMYNNTHAHFGLVGFQGIVGSTPESTFTQPNIANNYPAGGSGEFLLPAVSLRRGDDESNYELVSERVVRMVPFGATNIGGATERAIGMFETGSRTDAKKAIIVFTDGIPTAGGPLSGEPSENCRRAAELARSRGIAVYTLGLALDPTLMPQQRSVLGDDVPTGMAYIAGNGSRFFQVTSASRLNRAFANLARHLTQLVQ